MARARRVYPNCCTSAFCGKVDCTGCPNKSVLDEFNDWVERHNAVPSDPVWSPNVYVAKT